MKWRKRSREKVSLFFFLSTQNAKRRRQLFIPLDSTRLDFIPFPVLRLFLSTAGDARRWRRDVLWDVGTCDPSTRLQQSQGTVEGRGGWNAQTVSQNGASTLPPPPPPYFNLIDLTLSEPTCFNDDDDDDDDAWHSVARVCVVIGLESC